MLTVSMFDAFDELQDRNVVGDVVAEDLGGVGLTGHADLDARSSPPLRSRGCW